MRAEKKSKENYYTLMVFSTDDFSTSIFVEILRCLAWSWQLLQVLEWLTATVASILAYSTSRTSNTVYYHPLQHERFFKFSGVFVSTFLIGFEYLELDI